MKNWKQRHFVALNQADNFQVKYYEKEGGKIKGTVELCGYSARSFDEEEVKEYGPNGIKLVSGYTIYVSTRTFIFLSSFFYFVLLLCFSFLIICIHVFNYCSFLSFFH